ncbi:acyloxyacyl hydrolase [uncultured Bacteroides sp.]|uniref:acyloxyacyl hydrolase n=1 Tax=uncultured Bacteroides sp. TaxID=162156 RepID=UPI00260E7AF8|nr:acyloxyacyl hydrolase [uncultured Bacteroides sp.]
MAGLFTIQTLTAKTDRTDSVSAKKNYPIINQIGIDFRPGYIFPTNDFLKGLNDREKPVRKAFSYHLKYSFKFNPQSRLGKLYPYTYQGIGISYTDFINRKEMGRPFGVYVFQGSRIARIAPKLTLDYEWNFGATFGWKPYNDNMYTDTGEENPDYNPYNRVVGSKVNAYLNVGLMLNWQIDPNWKLSLGVDATHYSNGNTHYPNSGINTIGGRIGLVRTFGNVEEPAHAQPLKTFRRHISYDVVVYGATKYKGIFFDDGRAKLAPGPFGVAGININPMYNFNKYLKAGISLDAQYDESANLREHVASEDADGMKFYRPPFREQFGVGLSLRAELIMPIFSINAGIGRNLIYKGDDWDGFYQVLALKTSITKNLFLHIGYQLSRFRDPNNLMLGLGYRFHNKR